MNEKIPNYGEGSATYDAVGGKSGLQSLVTEFYRIMDESPAYKVIRDMHPQDLTMSIDKLISFLSGWMGGEALYLKKYGGGGMPQKHMHLSIGETERDMWLSCMKDALLKQSYPESLVQYLLTELTFPAERIYITSKEKNKNN